MWTTFHHLNSIGRRWWQQRRAPHLLGVRTKLSKTFSTAKLFCDFPYIAISDRFCICDCLHRIWKLRHIKMAFGHQCDRSFRSNTRLWLVSFMAHSIFHGFLLCHGHDHHYVILRQLLLLYLRHGRPFQRGCKFNWKNSWTHAIREWAAENQENSSTNQHSIVQTHQVSS